MTKDQATEKKHTFKEPGIYLGLPESEYFEDGSLGGTSIKKCIYEAAEWWWESDFNPLKPKPDPKKKEKISNGKKFGRALHKAILEGIEAYDDCYALEFDPSQFPDALETAAEMQEVIDNYNAENIDPDAIHLVADIKNAIKDRGGKTSGNKQELIARLLELDSDVNIATFKPLSSAGSKDELAARIMDADIDVELMEPHRQAYISKVGEREIIKQDWDASIRIMSRIAAHDPTVSEILSEGLPEVSVFWNDDSVPCRARFDWLRVRGQYDLKSFSGMTSKPVRQSCVRAIENYRYDLQEAHYRAARAAMKDLPIFGGTDEERAYIEKCKDEKDPYFKFIFYKSIGAPILRTAANPDTVIELAQMDRQRAFDNWRLFYNEFGLDNPWLTPSQDLDLDPSHFSSWFGVAA